MSRKEELIRAAIERFAEQGYHRTTVADIVSSAGVAQGTFYLYFESKKEIFVTLLQRFISMVEEAVLNVDLQSPSVSTVEDVAVEIKMAIRRVLTVYQDNVALARIFLREGTGLDPNFNQVRETAIDRLAFYGATIMDQAIEKGALPPQNSIVIAHCVVGMIEHVANYWLFKAPDLDLDELVEAVARFEMLGIGGWPTPQMTKVLSAT